MTVITTSLHVSHQQKTLLKPYRPPNTKILLVVLKTGRSTPACLLAGCIGKTDMALSPDLASMHTDLKVTVQNL